MQIARQLTHYIAPEVCDEVAHCMHHFKKDLKKSMVQKIVGTIEGTITRAFKQHAVAAKFSEAENEADRVSMQENVQGREFYSLISLLLSLYMSLCVLLRYMYEYLVLMNALSLNTN